jgi:hypothetical protein
MTRHDPELAKRLYARHTPVLWGHVVDMGESLNAALVNLARERTLDALDDVLARLKGAETGLQQMRRALARQP